MSSSTDLKQELIEAIVERTGESVRPTLTSYIDMVIECVKIETKAKIASTILEIEL